ncbi:MULTISPECIES: electron transport complex subunit RsxC [Sporomusa]|jgi:electron transport complex protein RnfC|uniref:Ion-translocating oxidoreductase complex subunit C n=2 Tax=Sporomusa TaxID=2375 RepID=A0ABM9W5S5_9FIRM|nr:electron transport complex subunit RsxC [Sporomusa sphaeroides]MCM0758271.1 electron transport complex subunit RsxC [Sporomusa sphaeroides DSM 2875]OLS57897.1 electron transport complex subunit RnfC [Sporomusa sphaeroides DSM 2875]CVK20410.1 Electron transport complex protein RnfC [Sporomusa sphaeroides DSM 2875]SCM80725.1 Electron transport complex subunit RnfC [uncultured Sporomusa sp.]
MAKSFRGGVHPDDRKRYTAAKAIEVAPIPRKVIIPTRQHLGAPCAPIVKVGDLVKKGQVVAEAQAFVASPIHASTSGKVVEIAEYPHPVFGACQAVVIESDDKDEWAPGLPLSRDWQSLDVKELKEIVRLAGLVGMGGATFPTHVKMSPPPEKPIDSFILNGAECEPYLTADHRVMLEQTERIITGMKIAMKILGVSKGYVGIEENKPDAIEIMRKACTGSAIEVVPLQTKYPQGAEKTLIKVILDREVPSGGLPMDVGTVVQNVGTMVAMADAVEKGIPLIERVATITGGAIAEPKNILLRVGATFAQAIELCGGFKEQPVKVIMGGPMMGMAQRTVDVPVIKGTSGILALSAADVNMGDEQPCIRCGRCVEACPMGLVPNMFSILGERGVFEVSVKEYNVLDCVECGSCVYVCPAKRNIVQYIKLCKVQNAAQAAAKK